VCVDMMALIVLRSMCVSVRVRESVCVCVDMIALFVLQSICVSVGV